MCRDHSSASCHIVRVCNVILPVISYTCSPNFIYCCATSIFTASYLSAFLRLAVNVMWNCSLMAPVKLFGSVKGGETCLLCKNRQYVWMSSLSSNLQYCICLCEEHLCLFSEYWLLSNSLRVMAKAIAGLVSHNILPLARHHNLAPWFQIITFYWTFMEFLMKTMINHWAERLHKLFTI